MINTAGMAGSATVSKALQKHPLRARQTEGQVFFRVNLRVSRALIRSNASLSIMTRAGQSWFCGALFARNYTR